LVYLLVYATTTHPIVTNFSGNAVHVPRKTTVDFDGNPDHVMFRLPLQLGGHTHRCKKKRPRKK